MAAFPTRRPHPRHRGLPRKNSTQPAATSKAPSSERSTGAGAERSRAIRKCEERSTRMTSRLLPKAVRTRWALVGERLSPAPIRQGSPTRSRRRAAAKRSTPRSPSKHLREAMGTYQAARDEHVTPMYEMTFDFARWISPRHETQQLWAVPRASRHERLRQSQAVPGARVLGGRGRTRQGSRVGREVKGFGSPEGA